MLAFFPIIIIIIIIITITVNLFFHIMLFENVNTRVMKDLAIQNIFTCFYMVYPNDCLVIIIIIIIFMVIVIIIIVIIISLLSLSLLITFAKIPNLGENQFLHYSSGIFYPYLSYLI